MSEIKEQLQHLVFGLDIGTRSIVGTVGYKEKNGFHVIAQCVKEHETRAMMDGQIHDITKVGETIAYVKRELEKQIDSPLTEVCIAAAGRVLKTITTEVACEFEEDTVIDKEHIYSLDMLGVEKAHGQLMETNDTDLKFYCVGYTVVKYFLNDYMFTNLEGHKGRKISEEIIATFLPEEVVDGLYAAVKIAGLNVANLTLEPIAAITVAIPEMYRMLNIGLVDVGAGTSDISITKDGSIIAYGMIPSAGDELTEVIARHYLVDFKTAEQIKKDAGTEEIVKFKDIMGTPFEVPASEVAEVIEPVLSQITSSVAEKIKELNGGKSVNAVFVVGGGGKFPGFTKHIAEELGLVPERVALRGEEVLQDVDFEQPDIKKDPLLVTPIGICLNYYDQKNNFIFVNFNNERIKMYDNNRLTVVDAALQAGFPNDGLFPKRGQELTFMLNGKKRFIRGEFGEAAVITLNGEPADLNTPISSNDRIIIQSSTAGANAKYTIGDIPDFHGTIMVNVNGKKVECPRFVEANGQKVSDFYDIQNDDEIVLLNYYTVQQLLEFMDVLLPEDAKIEVNHEQADRMTLVYENFSVEWHADEFADDDRMQQEDAVEDVQEPAETEIKEQEESITAGESEVMPKEEPKEVSGDNEPEKQPVKQTVPVTLTVTVNQKPVTMTGKPQYVFVDVFDWIDFDLQDSRGRAIKTLVNGENAGFMDVLKDSDQIDIYWEGQK